MRFSIRDLFWLLLCVGVGLATYAFEHRRFIESEKKVLEWQFRATIGKELR